ncbi:uncharacterized protein TNCV_3846441 [Trichonephila clavipes]|nr:uncharacterized protein TNCV_3846441 [Trichonephila clavipes]
MNMKRKENFQMLSKELHQLKIRSHKCTTRFNSPCQEDTRKKKFNLLFVDHQRCHEFEPSTTKDTPYRGEKIITPFRKLVLGTDGAEYVGGNIEKLFDEARNNMQRQYKTWEKYYNRKRRAINIKVNDLVLVPTHFISEGGRKVVGKFMPKFEEPYRVLEVQKNNLTIWKRGRRVTVNVDQVRIYHPRNTETTS